MEKPKEKGCYFCRVNRELQEDPEKKISTLKFEGEFWNVLYRISPQGNHVVVSKPAAIANKQIIASRTHATRRTDLCELAWPDLITVIEGFKKKFGVSNLDFTVSDSTGDSKDTKGHYRIILDVKFPKPPRS